VNVLPRQELPPDTTTCVNALPLYTGVCPIPASSGKTQCHRLNRGGHRQANAALHRAVIVRMQYHQPTQAYAARRTALGKTKAEIIRCLKRFLAREIWALIKPLRTPPQPPTTTS
jgi:transposase